MSDERQMAQWNRIYKSYDKDGDQAVTFAEWLLMKNGEMTRDREQRERGWFDQADTDKNEELSVDEWVAWNANRGR